MISPPTDRLHKFLAISGLLLIVTGFIVPLQKYNEAKLESISAQEKLEALKFSHERFAQKVLQEKHSFGHLFDTQTGELKEGITVEQFRNSAKAFFAR